MGASSDDCLANRELKLFEELKIAVWSEDLAFIGHAVNAVRGQGFLDSEIYSVVLKLNPLMTQKKWDHLVVHALELVKK